jgi:hypothetical protein
MSFDTDEELFGETTEEGFGDVDPTEGGQVEFSDSEPEKSYINPDEFADKYVRVKVDGEELEVPFAEALSGYQRQADYTRKTQELAAQREQAQFAATLQQALQANPEATIRLLQEQYGVAEANRMVNESYDQQSNDEVFDPVEQRLMQMEQSFTTLQQQWEYQQAQQKLAQSVAALQQRHGLDADTTRAVVATALQMGVGPEAFDQVYKAIAYDRMVAEQQARQQYDEKRRGEDEQRTAAKADAAQTITAGASANGTMVGSDGPMSVREAFEAALRAS